MAKEEGKYGKYDMHAEEIRFEIDRRREKWKTWGVWIAIPGGVIAAIAAVANFLLHSK